MDTPKTPLTATDAPVPRNPDRTAADREVLKALEVLTAKAAAAGVDLSAETGRFRTALAAHPATPPQEGEAIVPDDVPGASPGASLQSLLKYWSLINEVIDLFSAFKGLEVGADEPLPPIKLFISGEHITWFTGSLHRDS